MLVLVLHSVDAVAKGLWSHSWELLSWPGLEVVCCCLAHGARPRIPMLGKTPQSCCGWKLAWATLWDNPCFLFQEGGRSVGKVACILHDTLLLGVVGTPLLLQLMLCWLGCAWGCWLAVSSVLLPQVFLLRLLVLHLWVLLLPFLPLLAGQGRCCPVCPCRQWIRTSTPQTLHSFHRMLVASASVCVLRQVLLMLLRLLPLVFRCCGPLPSVLVEGPPLLSWDQALLLSPCALFVVKHVSSPVAVVVCCLLKVPQCSGIEPSSVGLPPKCSLLLPVVVLELTWMLPGSLLCCHEKFHGTVDTAVAVRTFSRTVG